jgi:hypothetical protein|tara:strand:- start:21363 stop:22004 length:642 start_codon:yes stop_codon:yes gene_type:complete
MKLKVKKQGKKKTYNLITNWEDVTLEKWLKLISLDGLTGAEESLEIISVLSDMPQKLIKELGITDVAEIMKRLNSMERKGEVDLKMLFELDGQEYAFHPQLEDMTLGEWADIETFIKNGLEDNLHNIMSVLFRPVKERENDAYIIDAYDGNIAVRAEKFKKMSAEQVQAALRFFFVFANAFSTILLSYLKERLKESPKPSLTKTLRANGDISD